MKCIIVDDEPLAIEILESYVQKIDGLQLVSTFRNAVSAFTYLQSHKVDLIFLDIQMPKLSGIDFVKTLKNPPKIIFTTAFRDYAIEGFELEVSDYLVKPIPFERFLKSVARVMQNNSIDSQTPPISTSSITQIENYLYFKVDKKMVKTRISDILYIESIKDYVKVKTTEREIITQQRISYLEESLPHDLFLRIHRSFIIAIDKIDAYSATEVEIGKYTIPVGRNYKNEVMKLLAKNVF